MSRKAKIWLTIFAIVFLIIGGIAIALKLYFTSDRLKALVIPRVEEATHRKVAINDISLSLFPNIGVTVEGLTISAPQEAQFDKREFLTLDELYLDVNIFALAKKRLEINEIILRHPQLYLEVNKDGVANYSQPGEAEVRKPETPKEHPTGPSGEAPKEHTGTMGFLLSDFQIVDGDVQYVDKTADRRILISGYDQKMHARVRSGGEDIFLESQSSIGGLSYGSTKSFLITDLPLTTYQRLTYKQAQDILSLDSVSIGIHEIALVLKGTVEHLQSKPMLDLSITSTKANLAQLLSLVPKEYMKAAQGLSSSGTFEFTMTIKGESTDFIQPAVSATFLVYNGSIRYTGLPKSITQVTLAGSFERPLVFAGKKQPWRIGMPTFSAMLGTSSLAGKLMVVDFDNPVLDASFNGEVNLGEVKEFYPLEQGTELTGLLKGNVMLSGKAKVPASIKADGKLEFRGVTIKTADSPKPLRDLTGVITFDNQVIETNRLSMNVGQSDLTLSFTMSNYFALVMEDAAGAGKPMMTSTLSSRQLRTVDLMSEQSETGSTGKEAQRGKKPGSAGPGQVDQKAGGQTQSALLPTMDVDANVSVGKLVTEKFEFNNARGAVKIRDGVITLQNFSVNAFEGTVVTKGMLDVRRMDKRPFDLDLNISNVQANALLPKFTSFGNNLFGKLSMNTSLAGDLNDTLGLNPKTLNGVGNVQIADGKYVGSPMTLKLADYTGINELRAMNFKDWSNAFTIADGRIHIKDLKIMASNTDLVVNGSQGFDGSLDYKMLLRLPGSASNRLKIGGLGGDVMNFLKDKEGRLNLNFNVTGTASSPVYALDTQEAQQKAKQALEQKAREGADRLKEEAKKKVEEGLKKLFKRP